MERPFSPLHGNDSGPFEILVEAEFFYLPRAFEAVEVDVIERDGAVVLVDEGECGAGSGVSGQSEGLRQALDEDRLAGAQGPDESDYVTGRETAGNAARNFGGRVRT